MSWFKYRRDGRVTQSIASLFLLDASVVFLNHGSYGACPRRVFDAYQAWQLKLERQPVAFLDPRRGLNGWMRDARVVLAAELGAGADDLVGMTNVTTGLNTVAQSLALQPGDEILTTDHEYAALEKTWGYAARRAGAKIVAAEVPLPLISEAAFTAAVLAAMTPRTRVLFLSHVTSATALRFPVEAILAESRARGIWSVIDGAHAPGHLPLNLAALGADFYSGNCHKWLMSPKGAAFLHARPLAQPMIDPLVISHGWADTEQVSGPFGGTRFIDGLEHQGTRDPAAWLTVPEAIAFRHQHDWHKIAACCRDLAQETACRVAEITGLPPFSSPEFCAPQMVAMPIPDCDPVALQRRLLAEHRIEIPCFRWKQHCIVRLSVQGYNNQSQMDALVSAMHTLMPGLRAAAQPLACMRSI